MTRPRLGEVLRLLFLFAGLLPWIPGILCWRPVVLEGCFAPLCHQRPERTLWLHGLPMLVCSRCAGIYLGIALAALHPVLPFLQRHGRTLLLVAAGIMVADWAASGLHPLWHAGRLATGLAVGWTGAAWSLALVTPLNAKPQVDALAE